MTAQSRTAAAPVRRFGAVYVPHGKIQSPVDAGGGGHRLRVHADPEAARALPRSPVRRQRPGRPQGSGGGRARHRAGDVADRHLAQEDRRRGRPQRDHHRPDDRQGDRPGDAVPVARGRHRGLHRLRRRLRRRLQLHLHEHHLVAGADDAAADGDQSARRVRAHVRRHRHGGRAARAHAHAPQHPRFGVEVGRAAAAGSRRARPVAARATTWTTCARSSAASSGRSSRPVPT